jgi:hypothetical protein
LKARDNPFASHRIEALTFRFPAGDDWDKFFVRLEKNGWRGVVLGTHGSGKTTLLAELEPMLGMRGFHPRRVTLRAPDAAADRQEALASIANLRAPDFLLLDGAEMLTTRQWLSLQTSVTACAGCLITQHRTGRLATVLQCETTPALLDELVHELCDAWLPEGETSKLLARHHGNIRECLGELYDRWAG